MAPSSIARPALAALAAGMAVALTLAGCAKKPTAVDPGYVPEGGLTSRSIMIGQPATPTLMGAGLLDQGQLVIVPINTRYVSGSAGSPRLMILDQTLAATYRLYRSTPDQGADLVLPWALQPLERWPDSQWELYDVALPQPDPGATYRALGLVEGVATKASPLTNGTRADLVPGTFSMFLPHGNPAAVPPTTFTDSLFTIRWDAVPGADRYLLHVFQFRSDTRDPDRLALTAPRAIAVGKTREIFLGILPGSAVQYKMGDPASVVLVTRQTYYGQEYFARLSAIDTAGRVIAIASPVSVYPGENLRAVFSLPQERALQLLPPEIGGPAIEEVFAISPDAVLSFDLGAMSIQPSRGFPMFQGAQGASSPGDRSAALALTSARWEDGARTGTPPTRLAPEGVEGERGLAASPPGVSRPR